jgi:hypothetical protein
VFRNNVEVNYGKIGPGYLFDLSYQEAYLDKGVNCYIDFLDEVPPSSQIKKYSRTSYGACENDVGRRILM